MKVGEIVSAGAFVAVAPGQALERRNNPAADAGPALQGIRLDDDACRTMTMNAANFCSLSSLKSFVPTVRLAVLPPNPASSLSQVAKSQVRSQDQFACGTRSYIGRQGARGRSEDRSCLDVRPLLLPPLVLRHRALTTSWRPTCQRRASPSPMGRSCR